MSEKVIIATGVASGKQYNGKELINIKLSDGRVGSSYERDFIGTNIEAEVEVKPAKEYQGVQQYYFNKPKNGFAGKTFQKKSTAAESAIIAASQAAIATMSAQNSENIIKVAEKFYSWIKEKENS